MTPFLKQTARHYYAEGNLEQLCFIFPNRRAKSFFGKYLGEEVAQHGKAVTAPMMTTMNEFFYHVQGTSSTDKVNLLLELYAQYKALNPMAESLDDFIFWGDVILSDFDDVDKYLVSPDHLFTNVADFKDIQDSYSYLTENQRAAIERFLEHFRGDGRLTVDMGSEKDYKARFLRIWDILLPLYRNFGAALSEKGFNYEGQVYRALVSRLEKEPIVDILSEAYPDARKFVFVGLNALNECEKKVMSRMRDAKLAEFCWDWSSAEIRAQHNRSSFFLSDNVARFPQAFRPDADGLGRPEINVLSVPSAVGQAKQIPSILEKFVGQDKCPGIETAIVLPDENLLIPVLNTIPAKINELNVTMGYPMGGSELWNLMNDVACMQTHMRCKDGEWLFYHKQVWAIFSNSIVKSVLSDKGREIVRSVKESSKYYIPLADLTGDTVLDLIFRAIVKDPGAADASQIGAVEEYQASLLSGLAPLIAEKPDMALELDFARDYHVAVKSLSRYDLPVLPATYFRLLNQLVGRAAVPFRGEPLNGLQIMGPLETRALDFENLIILNCNEGVFPRKSVSSSFVPPELRKGFGLPTYEYQDSVWAYYFYRLIQRASKVWMVMDSRTEGVRSGEESRYIKQLEFDFGFKINRYVVSAPIDKTPDSEYVEKTQEDIDKLRNWHLSATSLQDYLSCHAKFYYGSVCRLSEDKEVMESLDAGMLGTVFHKTMENLYKPDVKGKPKVFTNKYLAGILKNKDRIREQVESLIKEQLHTIEIVGRNIIFRDVVCKYVVKVIERDIELMKRYGVNEFSVLGVEIPTGAMIDGYEFVGKIDRLDSFSSKEIRVVDYKTGKVNDEDFIITEENAESVVNALFAEDSKERPKIALQLYIYDRFVSEDKKYSDKAIVNSIYQPSRLHVKEVENVSLNSKFCDLMKKSLSDMLAEISDVSRPWTRTSNPKVCEYCDFKMICGR